MKKYAVTTCCLLLCVLLCAASGMTDLSRDCDTLRQSVLRLHIVGASDSEADQSAKLAVRDALLQRFTELFDGSEDEDSAALRAAGALAEFEQTANGVLNSLGLDYRAQASLGEKYFPTVDYGDFTLPSGQYEAITVRLGGAEGRNWFCIAFPPLCVSASKEREREAAAVLRSGEWKIVSKSGGYVIRLKILEFFKRAAARD